MPAINDTSYAYGGSNLDAAAVPEVVTLEGGAERTLQVLVPNGVLRPIDPENGTTIPLTAIRGPANEVLTDYPTTDDVGEWHFRLIGYPTCNLGVTGAEDDAEEKVFENISSAQALTQVITQGITGASTFDGAVDWNTQVENRPTIPADAADVGAIPTTDRGAPNGVAPLTAGKVPIGNLPVGTDSSSVAGGLHTHAFGWPALPTNTYVKLAVVVLQSAPGVFPDLPSELSSSALLRIFQGPIRPSVGMRADDWWANTAP